MLMDMIIGFFRDTLVGPFYIVWVVILVILIFACIGYLAEKGINKKKEKEKYAAVSDAGSVDNLTSPESTVQDTFVNEPVSEAVNVAKVESTPVTTSVSEPVTTTSSSVEVPIVSEVVTTPVEEVSSVNESVNISSTVAPQVEGTVVQQAEVVEPTNTVVTPTVVNTDNVVNPSGEVNNVVIPTINQDGNNTN